MKHLALFLTFISSGFIAFAQIEQGDTKQVYQDNSRPGIVNYDRAAPFWDEDFSGGFPADWVLIDSSGICPWTFSTDGSWGNFSSSGTGSGDAPLSSTTGSNGFLICDNDSANHFTYGQPSSTNYQYLASYFGTSAVNCSGHSSVILRFEHAYRYNNTVPLIVQVSTDSVNWTSFNVSGGLANNTASANPDVEILNISTLAANQPTVYLRFGWSARVYYWMIDDISLSEADANDVMMGNGFWGHGNFQYQYFKIPFEQTGPISFYGPLTNNTGTAMTDVHFSIDVSNGTSVMNSNSNMLSLAAAETDTAVSVSTWTPDAVGSYTTTFTGNITGLTDDNLANNEYIDGIEITSSLYGIDNIALDGTGYAGGITNWSGNGGSVFGIGNVYEIIANGEIESVEIGVTTAAANEGNLIYGAIYYYDGSDWIFLGQTSDHAVTSTDLGKVVTLSFDTPIPVNANDEIVVIAGHYGGTDVQFMMAQTVPAGMVYGFDGAGSWYYLGAPKAIVARANFVNGIGNSQQISSASINCFPNPADQFVNAELNLSENSIVQINILDFNGRNVSTQQPIELSSGKHTLNLKTHMLATGIYTIEFKINDSVTYQKIVIQ